MRSNYCVPPDGIEMGRVSVMLKTVIQDSNLGYRFAIADTKPRNESGLRDD